MQYEYDGRKQLPVYANGFKDVPEGLRRHHWITPVKFDQLSKLQLKVRMCCPKCEEKVKEEIWEVRGVFDVRTMRPKKVIVVAMPDPFGWPFGLDEKEVLRKAKKIDCRAKFVPLDAIELLKPQKITQDSGDKQSTGNPQGGQKPGGKNPGGQQPSGQQGGVTNVVYPPGGNNMAIVPYHPPLYQPSTSWQGVYGRPSEPPYQEDYVHYFHFLLLALFVSMLIFR